MIPQGRGKAKWWYGWRARHSARQLDAEPHVPSVWIQQVIALNGIVPSALVS